MGFKASGGAPDSPTREPLEGASYGREIHRVSEAYPQINIINLRSLCTSKVLREA
jgi:hypothetical protein